MARSIGSIEVSVNLDTKRLEATAVSEGKKVGIATKEEIEEQLSKIEANIAKIDGRKEAQLLRAQIENAVRDITATLDFTEARATLRAFEEQAEAVRLMLNVNADLSEADMAEIRLDYAGFKERIEADALEVKLKLDRTELIRELAQARVEAEAATRRDLFLRVGLDVDSATGLAQAEADILGFEATHPDAVIRANIETELNQAKIRFDLATLDAMVENYDFDANVQVRVDKASKAAADALIENNMRETGARSGEAFGGSFLTGDNTKLIIAAVASMGDALASGLSGATGAITAVISSGVTAIGSAAGAATPLIAAFGNSIGAVVVGSRGMGDALQAVNKEFAAAREEGRDMNLANEDVLASLQNLSPEARRTAEAFAGIRDELQDVRMDVQERLFSGFAAVVADLGRTVLPDVADALGQAADSTNRFGKQLADVAAETDLSGLAAQLTPALDDAFDAATALFDMIGPFLEAAAGPAERLAEMIERGAEGMRDWVDANPTAITEFLDSGLTSLESWVELLKSTGDLLATLFDAGRESGDNFVVSLNNMIERWDGFLESAEGQSALQGFFDDAREAMDALRPVMEGLKEAFDVLVTDETQEHFENLAQAIGDALPVLGQMIGIIGELELAAAFANLFATLEPFFRLLQLIPDDLLRMAGTAIVVSAAVLKINTAVKTLSATFTALKAANPYILAIAAAATVAVIAFDAFGSKADAAAQQTENLTRSLQDNVDATINAGDAADSAAVGFDSLNKSIFEGTDGGDKIQESFELINKGAGDATLGIEDTTEVLTGLRKEGEGSIPTLQSLAEGFGLPTEAAGALAEIVAETDDNMKLAAQTATPLGHKMTDLAEATGIPREELVKLFGALEELQDQSEQTDMTAMQQAFIDTTSTGTEAEQAVLANAEAMQKSGEIAAGTGPLYEELVRQLYEQANASDDAANAEGVYADEVARAAQARQDASDASAAATAAFKEEQDAAFLAWQEELNLADATAEAAIAAADAAGFSSELAEEIVNLGTAAHDAAEDAQAFKDALDLLIGPGVSVQETFSNIQQAIDDFSVAIQGGQEALDLRTEAMEKATEANEKFAEAAVEEDPERAAQIQAEADALLAESEAANISADSLEKNAASLDLNTQAGRDNAELLRTHAAEILAWAGAQIAAGESAESVAAGVDIARQTLIDEADAFGLTRGKAEEYVDVLLGTPELINTVIETPGMFEALLNAEDLTLLYDEAGNPVITEFEALGIDPALADSQEFKDLLDQLNLIEATPTVDASGAVIGKETVDNMKGAVDTLGKASAKPKVDVDEKKPRDKMDVLQGQLKKLDDTVAAPSILIHNLESSIIRVGVLDTAINNLNDKTVTVTVDQRTTGTAGGAFGSPFQSMAGEIIHFPTVRQVGERGYREAIVPLDLPLNRVSPEVRQLATLLRGGGSSINLPAGRTINNYLNVTPLSADPEAVATSVLNRAAVLAR